MTRPIRRSPANACLGRAVLLVLALAGTLACTTIANPAWCDPDDATAGCAPGYRCTAEHACVGGGDAGPACTSGDSCPAAAGVCDDAERVCRGCQAPGECAGRTDGLDRCAASGACVACLVSADCEEATAAVCGADGMCHPCSSTEDCGAWSPGASAAMCVDGRCLVDTATVFVDANATCGPGSADVATPACTLEDGLAAATTRGLEDLVLVASAGGYDPITLAQAIRIYGRGRPTIRGSSGDRVVRIAGAIADVDLRGLRVTGGTGGGGVGVVCEDGARCQLVDVEVSGNSLGIEIDLAAEARLQGLLVHDNLAGGIDVGRSPLVLSSSFVWRNGTGTSSLGGVRVRSGDPVDLVVRHLTVLDNAATSAVAPGIACDVAFGVSSTILWDHGRTSASTECAMTYSSTETLRAGLGNREGDPGVMETGASAELHLVSGSPCRDAGEPGVPLLEPDVDGEPRDVLPDIGADELPPL